MMSKLLIALHTAPKGFLRKKPPYNTSDVLHLIDKAASMGFFGFQLGPLWSFPNIDGVQVKKRLDALQLHRNVHVGGIYNAEKFLSDDDVYRQALNEICNGINLCRQVSSKLVSFHPPFFPDNRKPDGDILVECQAAFRTFIHQIMSLTEPYEIAIAVESFCYPPFIFSGIKDFTAFIQQFPPKQVGIVADIGHLFQARLDVNNFLLKCRHRLKEIHIHDATHGLDYRQATHLPIGQGEINFTALIKTLRIIEYQGWLTLEIRGTEREILMSKKDLEATLLKLNGKPIVNKYPEESM